MASGDDGLARGTEINEFVVERVLGVGGFGVTYLAADRKLDRWVAIKEYLPRDWGTRRADGTVGPRSSSDAEDYQWGLARFLEEARTLARLDDARILRVYQVLEGRGTACMVTEYVEGRNLEETLTAEGPWPEARVRALLEDLLPGLAAVHQADLVHRDIKPANVMVRVDGTPVLIDFGAARYAAGAHSHSLTSVLTPGYAPHEQYLTAGKQGPWTDVYALGAVAYRALSGRAPVEATARVRADPLAPLAQIAPGRVSEAFEKAVTAALAVWPEDRPQDVAAWRAQWAGGSVVGSAIGASTDAGRVLSDAENPPGREPGSPDSRILSADRRAVAAALAVVAGVTVGIAGWVWDGNPGDTGESTSPATVGEPLSVPVAPAVSDQDSSPGDPGSDTVDAETDNAADAGESIESMSPVVADERLPVPMVADVQAELTRHGLYAGAIDGEWGPRTVRAARAYASVLRIPVAGFDLMDPVQFADLVSEEALAGRDDLPIDCDACPEMVVIPAGTFQMGVPASTEGMDDAKPRHPVTLGAFALGRYEVTRDEYDAFATAVEHVASGGCQVVGRDVDAEQGYSWSIDVALSWFDPGFEQLDRHPVVCVSWADANAYAQWLSDKTGKRYRLPTEAEWEYAARAGSTVSRYWGDSSGEQCRYANGGDNTLRKTSIFGEVDDLAPCTDGAGRTAAVGSFTPNRFGLFDMMGNVWEWVEDCQHDNYAAAPRDGSAWTAGGDCDQRMLRGGAWDAENRGDRFRLGQRMPHPREVREDHVGFRVAKTLD